MSTGMRTLHDLKMINKVWGKGSRKDLYEVVPDWYQSFSDFFSIKWRSAVEQNMTALRRSLKELEALEIEFQNEPAFIEIAELDKEKLVEALRYYTWLDRLIDSFETGEIFDFIPKEQ